MMKSELRRFAETTSLKGIPRIVKAKSPAIRALWLVAVLCLMMFTVYNCYNLIAQYLQKPKAITVNDVNAFGEGYFEHPYLFSPPDITVCNQNPLTAYNNLPREVGSSWEEYISMATSILGTMEHDRVREGQYKSSRGYLEYLGPGVIVTDWAMHKFIIDCTWGYLLDLTRFPCDDIAVLTYYPSVSYSQCYTVALNMSHPRIAQQYPSYIALTLYLDEVNAPDVPVFSTEVRGTAGAVVALHQSRQLPVWEDAIYASPGELTTIRVTKSLQTKISDDVSP